MPCEMCGKPLPFHATIVVEGARMRVCAGCAKFGKVVEEPRPKGAAPSGSGPAVGPAPRPRNRAEKPVPLESDEELVADFGERIRKAREGRRVTVEDLARAINERQSIVQKVEAGTYFPDPELTRKIEASLQIRLRERVEAVHPEKARAQGGVTIGDLIKMQKK
jgi:putative transcription factor